MPILQGEQFQKLGRYNVKLWEDYGDLETLNLIGTWGDLHNIFRTIHQSKGVFEVHDPSQHPLFRIYQIMDTAVTVWQRDTEHGTYLTVYNKDKEKRRQTVKFLDEVLE